MKNWTVLLIQAILNFCIVYPLLYIIHPKEGFLAIALLLTAFGSVNVIAGMKLGES